VVADFELLDANLRQSFRVLAQGRPRADITELEGVSIASLGAAFQMFNAAFLSRPVAAREELEARLECAQRLFRSRRMSWSFWICEGWLERPARRALSGACESFGLRPAAEMPCMVADCLRDPKGRIAPIPQVLRADTPDTMEDFRAIGSVCFHVPAIWFREVFDDTLPSREFTCWVAYRGDKAIATAATVVSNGVIGIYNVATMPEERGRGYGEAITRYAVEQASRQSGLSRVILQSTAQGERLYRRLGFREVSNVVVFNSL
jgi:GNAT superfamily N-acetyltransferase